MKSCTGCIATHEGKVCQLNIPLIKYVEDGYKVTRPLEDCPKPMTHAQLVAELDVMRRTR
jgi:hypothetical protein